MLIPTQESPPKIGKHSREIFVRSLPHSISDAKYATAPIFFSLSLSFSPRRRIFGAFSLPKKKPNAKSGRGARTKIRGSVRNVFAELSFSLFRPVSKFEPWQREREHPNRVFYSEHLQLDFRSCFHLPCAKILYAKDIFPGDSFLCVWFVRMP